MPVDPSKGQKKTKTGQKKLTQQIAKLDGFLLDFARWRAGSGGNLSGGHLWTLGLLKGALTKG